LDSVLCQIFSHPETTIVGFAFHSDISMLSKFLKHMKFYKKITALLDLQGYY